MGRIMVFLPRIENREKVLRTLLIKENGEDHDFKNLAATIEGYSVSDLKICDVLFPIWGKNVSYYLEFLQALISKNRTFA